MVFVASAVYCRSRCRNCCCYKWACGLETASSGFAGGGLVFGVKPVEAEARARNQGFAFSN